MICFPSRSDDHIIYDFFGGLDAARRLQGDFGFFFRTRPAENIAVRERIGDNLVIDVGQLPLGDQRQPNLARAAAS